MKPIRAPLWAILLMTACVPGFTIRPGPVKFYEGPEQPADSLARFENDWTMFLESIDGRNLRRWTQNHTILAVHILPGTHTLVAGPSERAGVVSMRALRIDFTAEAGHRYVLSRRISGAGRNSVWAPVFTDVTTGRQLLLDTSDLERLAVRFIDSF